jgi:DUF4097 and DUF4098 domain-containing protein YvlB
VGNFSYSAHTITNVDIEWVSGKVEIVQSDKDILTVSEGASYAVDAQKMHYYIDSNTLYIKYCQSGLKLDFDQADKDLRVEIAAGIDLEIESVNAKVAIGEVTLDELSAETVSGSITAEKVTAKEVSMEAVGGSLSLGLTTACREVDLETVGGNVTLALWNGLGAKIEFSTLSGKLKTERRYGKSGRRYDVFGEDGVSTECTVEVSTVGGNLIVK